MRAHNHGHTHTHAHGKKKTMCTCYTMAQVCVQLHGNARRVRAVANVCVCVRVGSLCVHRRISVSYSQLWRAVLLPHVCELWWWVRVSTSGYFKLIMAKFSLAKLSMQSLIGLIQHNKYTRQAARNALGFVAATAAVYTYSDTCVLTGKSSKPLLSIPKIQPATIWSESCSQENNVEDFRHIRSQVTWQILMWTFYLLKPEW